MRIVRAVLIAWFVVIFVPRAFGQAKIAAQPVKAVRFGKLWDGHGKVWTGAIVIVIIVAVTIIDLLSQIIRTRLI